VSFGSTNGPSSNPKSEGRRIARAHDATHCQNGVSAWPLSRQSTAFPPEVRPRDETLRESLMKNRVSMSMCPSPPSASDEVPSSG
jgi:hypothetical protein